MKTYAWRPHLDRDSLFNPFNRATERGPRLERMQIADAHTEEADRPVEPNASAAAEPPDTSRTPRAKE